MNRFLLIVLCGLSLNFDACSSLRNKSEALLSRIEQVKAGVTSKEQVKALFGTPSKVASVDPGISQAYDGYIWDYYQGSYSRFSFYFPKKSEKVAGVTWKVREGDPEQSLPYTKEKYSNKWVLQSSYMFTPHVVPDECYFEDKSKGISIEYRRIRQEVATISWWDSSRIPAGSPTARKMKSCVGGECIEFSPKKMQSICDG